MKSVALICIFTLFCIGCNATQPNPPQPVESSTTNVDDSTIHPPTVNPTSTPLLTATITPGSTPTATSTVTSTVKSTPTLDVSLFADKWSVYTDPTGYSFEYPTLYHQPDFNYCQVNKNGKNVSIGARIGFYFVDTNGLTVEADATNIINQLEVTRTEEGFAPSRDDALTVEYRFG